VIKDERWPVARLIPVTTASGVEAKERCSASAFLAVMSAVEEFGRAILKPLGAPAGKVETFVEVPFKTDKGNIRPDGLIAVTRGSRTWSALVEVKTGPNELSPAQVEAYLDLARDNGIDALVTVSNQSVTMSSEYPIAFDRRKAKRVQLQHWSWFRILTEAEVQRRHRGVKDPDQAYILSELIRYLSDGRSGIVMFGDMGPSWTNVREGARLHTLRRSDEHVEAVSARWDELIRFLTLDLTRELGRDVRQVVTKAESTAAGRTQALKESLATKGQLYATLSIPDTAGSLEVMADLNARQVSIRTRIDPPRDSRNRGRVSWLLRQLAKSPPNLIVEALISRSTTSLSGQLSKVREEPDRLVPDRDKEIRGFVLTLAQDMGLNRAAGRGSFIESDTKATKLFYRDVLQNLTAWKPRAPKLTTVAEEEPAALEDGPPALVAAVEAAEKEADPINAPEP